MRVLVVRPRAQAEATARRLALRGHEALVAPLLAIEAGAGSFPDIQPDGVVVTSANAARAAAAAGLRDLPVFAVGAKTKDALAALGVGDVRSAAGDGAALARLVAGGLPPGATLLHIAGRHLRPEPKRSLEKAGYRVVVHEAYAAASAATLPETVAEALEAGALDAALHYSRRSAETLVSLARDAGHGDALAGLLHACLSEEVARGLGPCPAERLAVAARPDEDALLAALDELGARMPGARAAAGRPVEVGTNPPARTFRSTKDDPPPMSDPRSPDPLKRTPPTIDLKPSEFQTVEAEAEPASTTADAPSAPGVAATTSEEATASAIEPTASLGLDGADRAREGAAGKNRGSRARVSAVGVPATGKASRPEPTAAETVAAPVEPHNSEAVAGRPAGETPVIDGLEPQEDTARAGTPPDLASTKAYDRPTETSDAPVRRKRSSGSGRLVAASLVGGVVGGALALGAERLLSAPVDSGGDRIAALERRVAAAPVPGDASSSGLQSRLTTLEAAVRQAGEAATAARGTADNAARQAGEALSRPLPATGGVPPQADPALRTALDGLIARVDALDGSLKRVDANAAAVDELGKRLDAAGRETAEKLAAASAVNDALGARVASLQEGSRTLGATAGSLQAGLQAVTAGAQALQTRAAETDTRLATLSGELAKLSPAAVQAGLRVVVAGRLADALRTGAPLGPALGVLEKLGGNPDALAALKPFAAAPPPAASTLAAEFKPLAQAMLAEPSAPATSFGDRLLRIADKVVTVRAVGDGSGNDLPGLVARIETALGRGALSEAARLWEGLPPEPKRASAEWAERLKRRVAADEAAGRLSAETVAALEASTR